MSAAVIARVDIAAAHDGEAELIVTLRYDNGGEARVALDEYAVRTLMASSAAAAPEALVGTSWEHVRDALAASSGRYS